MWGFLNDFDLRIKGHSTKGMSCTDKNTMVFVVLEGEITVILHTTQVSPTHYLGLYISVKMLNLLVLVQREEGGLFLHPAQELLQPDQPES